MAPNVPRQSVYFNPNANANQLSNIYACVGHLQTACTSLHETNAALEFHTGDLKRLNTAMTNQRHFDLVSEREVRQAREHVAAEIAPLLRELIMRAEEVLGKDEQHARTLRTKVRTYMRLYQATEELAKVDAQAQLLAEEKDAALGRTVTQKEFDAQKQELEKLRKQRAQLMERVNTLEQQGTSILSSIYPP